MRHYFHENFLSFFLTWFRFLPINDFYVCPFPKTLTGRCLRTFTNHFIHLSEGSLTKHIFLSINCISDQLLVVNFLNPWKIGIWIFRLFHRHWYQQIKNYKEKTLLSIFWSWENVALLRNFYRFLKILKLLNAREPRRLQMSSSK